MATPSNTITKRLWRLPGHSWESGRRLWKAVTILILVALLWWGYTRTSQPINLVINGQPRPILTHHLTPATILTELGINLEPEDRVQPPLQTSLAPGDRLSIQLARPVHVDADGQAHHVLTHSQTAADVLAELNLTLNPRDVLLINGALASHQASLPEPQPAATQDAHNRLLALTTPKGNLVASRPEPVYLIVHRSIPVTLYEGLARSRFYTALPTVGEALLEQGIILFLGDKVIPSLGTPLTPGMHIFIERSTPVTIMADGNILNTRTHRETVGQVLAEEEIALMGQDYTQPALNAPIADNTTIEVVRVRDAVEISAEYIPFETEWIPAEEMELDQQEVRQEGQLGVIKTRTRVRYENDQEIWREFEDEWLHQEPENRVIAYGTNVVIRTLDTPDGPIEYWRKIPMRTSAYSAATSGKDLDHPRYGVTRSGLPAGFGVVAVDPRVIPLMTDLYIEDYGPAVAGDTGGRILGRHIDLGYPDDQPLPVIFDWRYVYVLTPVPPPGQLRYVLPNWPQNNE